MEVTGETKRLMEERFGKDSLIALATMDEGRPTVRAVNSYYMDGCFYVITHARSGKMQQLEKDPAAAICGEWFTGHGLGENIGALSAPENAVLRARLKEAFSSWYNNGHMDENGPETCILRITLTDGVLLSHGRRFSF